MKKFFTKLTLDWWYAATIRAVKTMAQTLLGFVTIGLAFEQVPWKFAISVALVAGIYSILTSLKGLPEVGTEGNVIINTDIDAGSAIVGLALTTAIEELQGKDVIRLKVEPGTTTPPSQE